MDNVQSIYPANDFRVVADSAAKEIKVGIIIGYSEDDELLIFGGGLLNGSGRQPCAKDWLWMIEKFKSELMSGAYNA